MALSSCSAQYHLKRAVKKDPSLLESKDTIVQFDTTIVTEAVLRTDTFTLSAIDTFEVFTDSISYVIIRQGDVFQAQVECEPDTITIRQTKTIKLPPSIEYVKKVPWWHYLIIGVLILLLILALARRR